MSDYSYFTIESTTETKLTEKNSRFIAIAIHVDSEKKIQTSLAFVKQKHPKASHHCYAWRLGTNKSLYRANDDGEPSGSAGRPILGQIDSFNLTNVLIIVVRYYGGVNLGVSGLIKAYKGSARLALKEAKIIKKQLQVQQSIRVDYRSMNDFRSWLSNFDIRILTEEYNDHTGLFTLTFPKTEEIVIQTELKQFSSNLDE